MGTRWRLSRGPWDGRVVIAWPARELQINVWTVAGELGEVVYTATGVTDGVIEAVYEGYRSRPDGV